MLRGKKGISAVVTTILVVLLSVLAVVIVWQILKPSLVETTSRISTSCIDVDLSLDEADCTNGSEKVKVTLNSGKISKLKVVFYDEEGDSIGDAQEIEDVPGELGTKTYTSADLNFTRAKSVNIAAVIESETGEEITCGFVLLSPRAC